MRLVVERERARALSDAAKAKADREARQKEEAKRLLSRKSRVCGPPDMAALERRMGKALGVLSPRSPSSDASEPISPTRKTVDGQLERANERRKGRSP